MIGLEPNIFSIQNLNELSADYRLYRIKGLNVDQTEYYQNRQYLVKRLSIELNSPILALQREDATYLVVPTDVPTFPEQYELIRRRVQFELASSTLHLDFTVREPENDEICTRFLQFAIQGELYKRPSLWQTASGRPFFEYTTLNQDGNIGHHRGYHVRVIPTDSGGLGIVVDVTGKFVSRMPLPAILTRNQFDQWRGNHLIYHFGQKWYEIQPYALDDYACEAYEFKEEEKWWNLLDYVIHKSKKPIPRELAETTKDDSVILYRSNGGDERAAIARLCYPVFGTDADSEAANFHQSNILIPEARRSAIHKFAAKYLSPLKFGNTRLTVSLSPEKAEVRMFNVPDLCFGQGKVLSTVGTEGALQVSLDHLGRTRKALLRDPIAGFYVRTKLDRQYLVLPASVNQSYGEAFIDDLKRAVNQLYPHGGGYNPTVIEYDDRGKRTFTVQGRSILDAIQNHGVKPGYALVVVHHASDRRKRQEDQLAGMITREIRERFDITAAVSHSQVPGESYQEYRTNDGKVKYRVHYKRRGKFTGYLANVALNKVLLTNQKWPFVLKKRLHADVTIGIDVKQNTAGIIVVGNGGFEIRSLVRTSRQKERLLEDQIRDYLLEILRQEAGSRSELIKTIVIHRDGRVYQSELIGLEAAIEILKREGIIHPDATLTVLEIPKHSPARLRLFDITDEYGQLCVNNPQIGCYYIVGNSQAYVCSTGRAFPHKGTAQPLHVRRAMGSLGIRECLEDVYALTTLAWTKPDDCSRYPITLKLCDRYLTEDATDYDTDALYRAEAVGDDEEEPEDE